MRVVVAPDKFKGSLTAAEVADAVASGLLAVAPDAEVVRVPIADGGDGTVAAALSRGFTAVPVEASGPTGEPVSATYARHDHQAVVELAGVCGLDLLPDRRPDPLGASTYGLGQVLAQAITHGATDIVLGIGGSASTDGGAGMVQALGARLLDEQGRDLPLGGGALQNLAQPRTDGAVAGGGRRPNCRRQRCGQPPARSAGSRCRVRPPEGSQPYRRLPARASPHGVGEAGGRGDRDRPREPGRWRARPGGPASQPWPC